jgi:hypothetical protein
MNEGIQEESALAEGQEKIENTQEGEGSLEYDEAGLEKLVDSANEQVDSSVAESIRHADNRVDAGPHSFGLDEKTGESIFTSGGFAERINTLRASLTALAANTKAKIAKLLGKKSEAIDSDETVAHEIVKQPTVSITQETEGSVEQQKSSEQEEAAAQEKYWADLKQKEQEKEKELDEYLEREIFPGLGILEEDEKRVLAETPEERKWLKERSFNNIRDTVRQFVKYYSEHGTFDDASYAEKEKSAEWEAVNELWGQYGGKSSKEAGLEVLSEQDLDAIAHDGSPYSKFRSIVLEKSEEIAARIYDEGGEGGDEDEGDQGQQTARTLLEAAKKEYEEKQQELQGAPKDFRIKQLIHQKLLEDWGYDEIAKGFYKEHQKRLPEREQYEKRFSREELAGMLRAEAEGVREHHAVTINIPYADLLAVLREGEFKTATSLTPEQRDQIEVHRGRNYQDSYFDRRKNIEQELGFKEGTSVAYGALADMGGPEGSFGGAASYGDIFLEIDEGPDFTYTEGDSYNFDSSQSGQWKKSGVEHKQLEVEHASISKAVNNIEGNLARKYQAGRGFSYLEVQIPNMTLDKIKKINVPYFDTVHAIPSFLTQEKVLNDLSQLADGEKWKQKINMIKKK